MPEETGIQQTQPTPPAPEYYQRSEYANGSDLLLKVAGQPVGHCTSHTVTYNSETKDHAVKPTATEPHSKGLWKDKTVSGLAISISFEGLRFWNEREGKLETVAAKWGTGDKVEVECFYREKDTEPYIKGMFVIDSLEESAPAQDDVTYSGNLSNAGEPEVYPGKA